MSTFRNDGVWDLRQFYRCYTTGTVTGQSNNPHYPPRMNGMEACKGPVAKFF
jgi:hypothetical protein